MATIVVVLLLAAGISFALKKMLRDKKNGKSVSCGGDCSRCGGGCH